MPRSNQTKHLLAESLQELMVTTPLEKISVNDIVDHAGVGRNTFYYHFQNKENLFTEVLQRKIEQFIQSVLPSEGTENLHFMENLYTLITQNFNIMAQNAMLARLLVNETEQMPDLLCDIAHKQYSGYLARLQHTLDKETEAGNIVPTNAERLILTICSLNIMAILVMPAIENLLPEQEQNRQKVQQRRLEENIRYIHSLLTTGIK